VEVKSRRIAADHGFFRTFVPLVAAARAAAHDLDDLPELARDIQNFIMSRCRMWKKPNPGVETSTLP